MKSPEDLNRQIEDETGIPNILWRVGVPMYGRRNVSCYEDTLTGLLEAEGVDLTILELRRAINYLMPSTTDFGRYWVGKQVAELVNSPDPKIVTLGCSTGLEVYWIAHYLQKLGLLTKQGVVRGVDINERALEEARAGRYDKYYFDVTFFDRYDDVKDALGIDAVAKTVNFSESLKKHVDFAKGNLLDIESLTSLGLADMDVVVLMNVIKYMNPSAQQKVLNNVSKVLSTGGIVLTDIYTSNLFEEHQSFHAVDENGRVFRRC